MKDKIKEKKKRLASGEKRGKLSKKSSTTTVPEKNFTVVDCYREIENIGKIPVLSSTLK